MLLRRAAISEEKTGERSHGGNLGAPRPILRADLERQPPLLEQYAIGAQQPRCRTVDVRRFRSDAVQLDDLEVALSERIGGRGPHVETPEVET
jgi:hypothetical protein